MAICEEVLAPFPNHNIRAGDLTRDRTVYLEHAFIYVKNKPRKYLISMHHFHTQFKTPQNIRYLNSYPRAHDQYGF